MPTIADIRQQFPQYGDMTDAALATALHAKFYSDMPRAVFDRKIGIAPAAPERSFTDNLKAGTYSLLKGLRDPLDAGAQMLERGVQALGVDTGKINTALGMPSADQATANAEAAYNDAWKGAPPSFDANRMAANIVATAPLAAAMPGAAAPSLLARTASGAASGAVTGLLQPTEAGLSNADFWARKGGQAAIGSASGGAANAGLAATGKLLRPAPVSAEAQRMLDAGVRLTPGQTLGGTVNAVEERLTSLPIVGDAVAGARRRALSDFNRAAIDEALAPIGARLPAGLEGHEAIRAAKTIVSDAYDRIVPNLGVKVNPEFKGSVNKIVDMAKNMPADRAAQFDGIMQREVFSRFSPGGGMTGESFKEMESSLSRIASGYRKSLVGDERTLGNAVDEVLRAARKLQMDSNPDKAKQLTALNSAFANLLRVKNAAARLGGEGGMFSPAQLQAASRSLDSTARKDAFATGAARMQDFAEAGKATIGNKIPDSGTASRGAQIAGGLGVIAAPATLPYVLGGAALGTAAYSPLGVEVTRGLFTRRPELLRKAGLGLLNAAPYAALGAGGQAVGLLR